MKGKIEGRIEVTGRRGKRRKQLLDDLKVKKEWQIRNAWIVQKCGAGEGWRRLVGPIM
jgi:hypothetical protein